MNIIKKFNGIRKGSFLIRNKKEIALSALSQIILISQLIIQNKLLAVNFTRLEYGDWALLLSLYVLISMLPFTAFDQAIAKMTYKKINSSEKFYFINNVYLVYLFLFFSYFIILAVGSSTLFSNTILWAYFFIFIFFTFTEILKNSLLLIDNAARNRLRVVFLRVFELLFRVLLLILIANYNSFTINNVLWIFIIGNLIIILASYKKFDTVFKYFRIQKIKNVYKEIVLFSYPLIIWAIFGWLHTMINRWYLDYYLNKEAVATYTILVSLSFFLPNAFYGIVNNFFMPYIFSKNTKTSIRFFKKFLLIIGLCLFLYSIFIFFTSDYLVIILADEKYLDISSFIPFLTITSSFYIIAMISTFEIYRSGATRKLLVPTILSGLIPSILGFFIIENFGLFGAIINHMFGQIVYAIIVIYISYRHIKGGNEID